MNIVTKSIFKANVPDEKLIEKCILKIINFVTKIHQKVKPKKIFIFGSDNDYLINRIDTFFLSEEILEIVKIDTSDSKPKSEYNSSKIFFDQKYPDKLINFNQHQKLDDVLIISNFNTFDELQKLIILCNIPNSSILTILVPNVASEFFKTAAYSSFFSTEKNLIKMNNDSILLVNYFVKKDYQLRFGNEVSIDDLVKIENLCWDKELRASKEEIIQRIKNYPQGQFLITKNNDILGVIYTQRVDILQSIYFVNYNNINSFFKKNGKFAQLVSLNVPNRKNHPSFDFDSGLAHHLLELALHVYSNLAGIEKIFAVTLCKNYNESEGHLENYIHLKNEDGLPKDSILRMHFYHGATIKELVPNYRPMDKKNLGCGVLVEYDVLNRYENEEKIFMNKFDIKYDGSINEKLILDSIKIVYSNSDLNLNTPFNVMGLDSLEYTDISIELSKKVGIQIDASIFYLCKTPLELYSHIVGLNKPSNKTQSKKAPENTEKKECKENLIAIIGMECRFPKFADNIENYWLSLKEGTSNIESIPKSRWNIDEYPSIYSKRGGFLKESIDLFDADFFNITKNEANMMDPQQRILLEVSWNALENSCLNPESLKSSRTSVFVGVSSNDYEEMIKSSGRFGDYIETGNLKSLLPGRLSYFYQLNGPSVSVDTACSSGLVALNYGCESILNGENDISIVAGVNIILTPSRTINDCYSKVLSSEGNCKVFDQTADGYIRSEGCGVLILKNYSKALNDKDNILAVIKGIGVNQNSGRNNLTAPNIDQQAELIKNVLLKSNCNANNIEYFEVNGSSTFLGDIIEINAIQKAFDTRDKSKQIILGSVKPNIGHLEAASGIAGLIKIIIALNKQEIPRQINLNKINNQIESELVWLEILRENRKWVSDSKKRCAAISSFGIGGTNAHCIVEEFKKEIENPIEILKNQWNSLKKNFDILSQIDCDYFNVNDRSHHMLVISAKNEKSLNDFQVKYLDFLEQTHNNIGDISFSAGIGRKHFDNRIAIIGKDAIEWLNCLKLDNNIYKRSMDLSFKMNTIKTAFIITNDFTNIFPFMSHELYNSNILFRACMDKCSNLIYNQLNISLIELIFGQNSSNYLKKNEYIQPVFFSIQYSLACLLETFGIVADLYYADCECLSAVLNNTISIEHGILLAIIYGKYLDGNLELKSNLFDFVQFKNSNMHKWYSTSLAKIFNTNNMNSSYWIQSFKNSYNQHKRNENLRNLYDTMNIRVFVNFNPSLNLDNLLRQIIDKEEIANLIILNTIRIKCPNWLSILDCLAQWYVNGGDILWKYFDSSYIRTKVVLPNYPFQRMSFWYDKDDDDDSPFKACKKTCQSSNDTIETKLNIIFKNILKLDHIAYEKNFFQMGGNSLKLSQLRSSIQDAFKIDLSFIELFKNSTINSIKKLISNKVPAFDLDVKLKSSISFMIFEPFPLTDVQASYFFGRQGFTSLGNVSTHLYYEVDLDQLDFNLFEESFNKMIHRHEMLRAVITNDGYQRVLEDFSYYYIKLNDISLLNSFDQQNYLLELRNNLSHQVIDCFNSPLYEFQVTKMTSSFRIHLSFDCLVFDMFSVYLIMDEWYKLYNGKAFSPALNVTFRDYVLHLADMNESDRFKEDKKYWGEKISQMASGPDIPLRINPNNVKSQKFERRVKVIEARVWENLKNLSLKLNISVTSILLGIFAAIIGRWSSNSKFSLNLTLFRREPIHPDINLVLGDFTCIEILSVDYKSFLNKNFLHCIEKLHEELWNDLEHVLYSGVNVQRDLKKLKGLNTTDITIPVVFTSLLNLNSIGVLGEKDKNKSCFQNFGNVTYSITQTPQIWLDNKVYEENGCLVIEWDYVSELFDEQLMQTMHYSYCSLIENVSIEFLEKPLAEILPVSIQEKILFKPVKIFTQKEILLHDLFIKNVEINPNKIAVRTENSNQITYQDLFKYSLNLSKVLLKLGAKPNMLIVVLMDKCIQSIIGFLSILMSGAAFIYIDPDTPESRIEELISISHSKIVLSLNKYRKKLVFTDDNNNYNIIYIDEPLTQSNEVIVKTKNNIDNLAYVIFTSGSTGIPKGVMITHRSVVNTILDVNSEFNVSNEDSILCISNFSFDLSIYDIFGMLAEGGTVVLMSKVNNREPGVWLKLIEEYKITIWNSVPMLMEMLCEHLSDLNYPKDLFSLIRVVLLSGDWIPLSLPGKIRKIFSNSHLELRSLGGATEASIWSVWYPITEIEPNMITVPYGRAMNNQFIYILNENFQNCAPLVIGHIYIGGVGIAKGYWNNEDITNEKFIKHTFTQERLYKTGDLGFWSFDGNAILLGREDFQIKLNGLRIELNEIEFYLNKLDYVQDSVVLLNEISNDNKNLIGIIKNSKLAKIDEKEDEIEKSKILNFKLNRFNIRKINANNKYFLNKAFKPTINEYYRRKSYRQYSSSNKLSKEKIENFLIKILQEFEPKSNEIDASTDIDIEEILGLLSAHKNDDSLLPKYIYPSAGSLYPVQIYVSLNTKKFKSAIYYFDPEQHTLSHISQNRYEQNTVFHLVACSSAIKPVYLDNWKKYSLIEAGCIIQLIKSVCHKSGYDLDQIGDNEISKDLKIGQEDFFIGSFMLTKSIKKESNFDLKICTIIQNSINEDQNGIYFLEKNHLKKTQDTNVHPIYMNFVGDYSKIIKNAHFLISMFGINSDISLIKAGSFLQYLCQAGLNENFGFCALGMPTLKFKKRNDLFELISLSGGYITNYQIIQQVTSEPSDFDETISDILSKYLNCYIPNYMVPSAFFFVDKFPISSNGKIDRKELNKIIETRIKIEKKESNNEIETDKSKINRIQYILDEIKNCLNVANLNPKASFLSNGGNSLYAVRLSNTLKKAGFIIKPTDFFLHSSIELLIRKFIKSEKLADKIETNLNVKMIAEEPIAIIGMSGRFPGSENIDQFWKNLCNGVEGTTYFSDEELLTLGVDIEQLNNPSYVKAKAMLSDIADFDADFFQYTPKEAQYTNPAIRLFLESVWNALESAGCNSSDEHLKIGIFAGSGGNDYLNGDYYQDEGFLKIVNNQDDYLATKVAFKFNFKGPAITVKTACSTGLVAVHLACQSLRLAESDIAVAGAVHTSYHEKCGYNFIQGSIFSKNGKCKTFDADADGIIESQGVGTVVLKRLSRAITDNDHIWAVIKGSAVNNDGSEKAGYTVPSVKSQIAVIADALKNSGVTPDQIGFIEAHGTGTPLGDPIEVYALTSVFENKKKVLIENQSVALGSVKTNIGHCITAAGIAGLIKSTLSIYYKQIPPSLHFKKPNPQISFELTPFYVITEKKKWLSEKPLIGGVSSFGIGGTNAHCIVEEFKKEIENPIEILKNQWNSLKKNFDILSQIDCDYFNANDRSHHMLVISAKNEKSLNDFQVKYLDFLEQTHNNIGDISFSAGIGRKHFDNRIAIIGKDAIEWLNCLKLDSNIYKRSMDLSFKMNTIKTAFIITNDFTNIFPFMSHELYNSNILFRACMDKCSNLIYNQLNISLIELIFGQNSSNYLKKNEYIQPVFFSIQYSLACLLETFGIVADLYYADCECLSAVLNNTISIEHGILLAIIYGKYLDGNLELKSNLFDFVQFKSSNMHKWYSTSLAKIFNTNNMNSSYWIQSFKNSYNQHKRNENLRNLYDTMNIRVFVNFNPSLNLDNLLRQIIDKEEIANLIILNTIRIKCPNWLSILDCLAQWYVNGGDILWKYFDSSYIRTKVVLPNYPFQRMSFWHNESKANANRNISFLNFTQDPIIIDNKIFFSTQFSLDISHFHYISDHILFDSNIFPGSAYIDYFVSISQILIDRYYKFENLRCTIKNIKFLKPLLAENSFFIEQLMVPQDEFFYTIKFTSCKKNFSFKRSLFQNQTLHSTADLFLEKNEINSIKKVNIREIKSRCTDHISASMFYELFSNNGFSYGSPFHSVKKICFNKTEIYAEIECFDKSEHALNSLILDASFQVLSYFLIKNSNKTNELSFIPYEIKKFQKFGNIQSKMVVHVYVDSLDATNGSIKVYNLNGELSCDIENFFLKAIQKDIFLKELNQNKAYYNNHYVENWILKNLNEKNLDRNFKKLTNELWIVFYDQNNHLILNTISSFHQNNIEFILVLMGTNFAQNKNNYEINCEIKEDYLNFFKMIKKPFNCLHLSGLSFENTNQFTETKSLLYIVQSCIQLNLKPNTIGVITCQNYLINQEKNLNLFRSTLNGLCRSIESEYPEFNLRQIDIDEMFCSTNDLISLFHEFAEPNESLFVVRRSNERYVPILQQANLARTNVKFELSDQFLITGSFGGLGFMLVQWFLTKGVKNLVLIGRNSPNLDQIASINSWKKQGMNIEIYCTDIGNKSEIERILLKETKITGIFHLAGVLQDKTLQNLSWNDFDKVYQAKVYGSYLLHQLTKEKKLKYFVVFSSLTAWIGSSGQANYTSANSFLDSLILSRRQMGLAGQSIAWGAWAQKGMATKYVSSLRKDGFESFTLEQGFDLLETALGHNSKKILITKANWDLLANKDTRYTEYFCKLAKSVIKNNTNEQNIGILIQKTNKNDGYRILKEKIENIIRKRLGSNEELDENMGFVDMGLDSLIMIGVRHDIQLEIGSLFNLSHTLLIESASIKKLCFDLISIIKKENNETDIFNWKMNTTPFIYACGSGVYESVISFIEEDHNINECDSNGRTGLHVATLENKKDIVQLLVTFDANQQIRDNDGLLPIDIAVKNKFTELVEILDH